MATTARNKRIGELFLTAAGQKAGPSIINREISLNVRIDACETLVKLRGGLGRHSRDRLKRILNEISAAAKVKLDAGNIDQPQHQSVVDRIEVVRLRLENLADRRPPKKLTPEEVNKILSDAIPPFPAPVDCFWQSAFAKGQVAWRLVVPVLFTVVSKEAVDKENPNVANTSTEAA